QFLENEFQILSSMVTSGHWVRKRDLVDTPPINLGRHDFMKIDFLGHIPNKSGPTIVRCDNKRVTLIARFSLEVCDLPKRESTNGYVSQRRKPVISRCSLRWSYECGFGWRRARRAWVSRKRTPLNRLGRFSFVYHSTHTNTVMRDSNRHYHAIETSDKRRTPAPLPAANPLQRH